MTRVTAAPVAAPAVPASANDQLARSFCVEPGPYTTSELGVMSIDAHE